MKLSEHYLLVALRATIHMDTVVGFSAGFSCAIQIAELPIGAFGPVLVDLGLEVGYSLSADSGLSVPGPGPGPGPGVRLRCSVNVRCMTGGRGGSLRQRPRRLCGQDRVDFHVASADNSTRLGTATTGRPGGRAVSCRC